MEESNEGPFSRLDAVTHFRYCDKTGKIFSNSNRRNVHVEEEVGTSDRQGYLVTTLFKRPVKIHRLAWMLWYGCWPSGQIDHINGDKSDNRIENLRVVNNRQNKQNIATPKSNTSGFMGVSFHKKSGKWAANIKINGKSKYLGLFDTPELASSAYKSAKKSIHPFNEVYQ